MTHPPWETAMVQGIVKQFSCGGKYGFIRPHGSDKDVFVHLSVVEEAGLDTLRPGQIVEIDIVPPVNEKKKPSAHNLRLVEKKFLPRDYEYGTVHSFDYSKGFGFIQPDGSGPQVFVHISEVKEAGLFILEGGQRIQYIIEQSPKHPTAIVATHLKLI